MTQKKINLKTDFDGKLNFLGNCCVIEPAKDITMYIVPNHDNN